MLPVFCGTQDFFGKQIKRVSEFTYLGVVFDERLSFNGHVKKLISKAGKRVGMVGRLRDNLTLHSANVVYTTLIRPILDYCDTVWGCCGEGNAQALQALQNRAARIIARTDRSSPATDILKWPSLADRRRNNVFKLVKNVLEGVVPNILRNISNVMVVFTSVQQGKRTNFTFLL